MFKGIPIFKYYRVKVNPPRWDSAMKYLKIGLGHISKGLESQALSEMFVFYAI